MHEMEGPAPVPRRRRLIAQLPSLRDRASLAPVRSPGRRASRRCASSDACRSLVRSLRGTAPASGQVDRSTVPHLGTSHLAREPADSCGFPLLPTPRSLPRAGPRAGDVRRFLVPGRQRPQGVSARSFGNLAIHNAVHSCAQVVPGPSTAKALVVHRFVHNHGHHPSTMWTRPTALPCVETACRSLCRDRSPLGRHSQTGIRGR